jgi:hypothetical protein
MILWESNAYQGSSYDPLLDRWQPISSICQPTTNRTPVAGLWAGNEMLVTGVFGGDGNGYSYRPSTDSWSVFSEIGSPEPRTDGTAIWTGSEMILWGGRGANGGLLNSGGRFRP